MTELQREMELIDNILDGYQFEQYAALLFRSSGIPRAEITPEKGDFGVDILLWKHHEKCAVQCKKYSRAVGSKAVQEVYSGRDYYGCDTACVLTNNYFTKGAKKLAAHLEVQLIDRQGLEELIEQVRVEEHCYPSQIKGQGLEQTMDTNILLRAAARIIASEGMVSPLVLQKGSVFPRRIRPACCRTCSIPACSVNRIKTR